MDHGHSAGSKAENQSLPADERAHSLSQAVNRARTLLKEGRPAEAERIYVRILQLDPANFDALHALGLMRRRQGRYQEAQALLSQAVVVKPDSAPALAGLGDVLCDLQQYDLAIDQYRKALEIGPGTERTLGQLGNALLNANRAEEALGCFRRVLTVRPDSVAALDNQGIALQRLGRHPEALASLERAIELRPDSAELHFHRGISFEALRRFREAILCYRRALNIRPDYFPALVNLGNALRALNRYADALLYYDKALAIRPDAPEPLNNRGTSLQYLNRDEEALASFEKALLIRPDSAEIHWNASLTRLRLGDFANGWREYEWRWRKKGFTTPLQDFSAPLWLGKEDLAGRTILLHAEQGLGDTLQFLRYVSLVARAGASVILEVQAPLKPVARLLGGVAQVIGQGEPLPRFDFHCPLLSLPLAFGTTATSIPADIPYLTPPSDRLEVWRSILGAKRRPRIGVVWAGAPTPRNRSMPLAMLGRCLGVPGFEFFSLQKDLPPGDGDILDAFNVRRETEKLRDFADTAAVISLLDLIISVDTATLHMAGALGKPVWCLLSFAADYRWPPNREDSPWYPTARLFRQPRLFDWQSVADAVEKQLQTLAQDLKSTR